MSRLSVLRQDGYAVRLDWGTDGARETARGARYAVVVDVLSFTTTVSVAVDAGMCGYPYRWGTDDADAPGFARSRERAPGRGPAGRLLDRAAARRGGRLRRARP
jgi:2-phosphosulfolactate phosphatase